MLEEEFKNQIREIANKHIKFFNENKIAELLKEVAFEFDKSIYYKQ